MNKSKIRNYTLSGVLLTYFGLKDLDNFVLLYNGVALALGITALIMAIVEFQKKKVE